MPTKEADSIEMVFIKELAKRLRSKIPACQQEKFNSENYSICFACKFFDDCYLLENASSTFKTQL
jgi:hypothetical protein